MSPSPHPNLHLALPPHALDALALSWLEEDCPSFDHAAVAASDAPRTATLYAKSPLVLAGAPFFSAVFARVACTVDWIHPDGHHVADASSSHKVALATVSGPASRLLLAERPALNALAECSAVATAARTAASAARKAGWQGRVAGTRKTAPGLRLVQKYGMLVGGMDTHRFDLSAMVMIKDNHIAAAGSVSAAIDAVRAGAGFSQKIDVEAADEQQAVLACRAGADVVMLDNFDIVELARVSSLVKKDWANVLVEASGGVSLDNIADYCLPHVDVISFSVNRHAPPVDMSLKIDPVAPPLPEKHA